MINPFEDEHGMYHVLMNSEGQHSLWPATIQTPRGWKIVKEAGDRASCLEFIEQHWTDMRPNSLTKVMEQSATTYDGDGRFGWVP
jgi:MbtH protein